MATCLKFVAVCLYLVVKASQCGIFGEEIRDGKDVIANSFGRRENFTTKGVSRFSVEDENHYKNAKEVRVSYEHIEKLYDLLFAIGTDVNQGLKFIFTTDAKRDCYDTEKIKGVLEDIKINQKLSVDIVSRWLAKEEEEGKEELLFMTTSQPDIYNVLYDTSQIDEAGNLTYVSTMKIETFPANESYSVATSQTDSHVSVTVIRTDLPFSTRETSTEMLPSVNESSTESYTRITELETKPFAFETLPESSTKLTSSKETSAEPYSYFTEAISTTAIEKIKEEHTPTSEISTLRYFSIPYLKTEPYFYVNETSTDLYFPTSEDLTESYLFTSKPSTELYSFATTKMAEKFYSPSEPFTELSSAAKPFTESYQHTVLSETESPNFPVSEYEELALNISEGLITSLPKEETTQNYTDLFFSGFNTTTTEIILANISERVVNLLTTELPYTVQEFETPTETKVFTTTEVLFRPIMWADIENITLLTKPIVTENITSNISEPFTEFPTTESIFQNITDLGEKVSIQTTGTGFPTNVTETFSTVSYFNETLETTKKEILQEYSTLETTSLNDTELYIFDEGFSTSVTTLQTHAPNISEHYKVPTTPHSTLSSSSEIFITETDLLNIQTTVSNVSEEILEFSTLGISLYNITKLYHSTPEAVLLELETASIPTTSFISPFPSNFSSTEVFGNETTVFVFDNASTPTPVAFATTPEPISNVTKTSYTKLYNETDPIDQWNKKLTIVQQNMSVISEELKKDSVNQTAYEEAKQTTAVLMELFLEMKNILKDVSGRVQKSQSFTSSPRLTKSNLRKKRQEINIKDDCLKSDCESLKEFEELVLLTKRASENPNDLLHLRRTRCCSMLMRKKLEKGEPMLGMQRERISYFVKEILTLHLPRLRRRLLEEEEKMSTEIRNLRSEFRKLLEMKNYILYMKSITSRS